MSTLPTSPEDDKLQFGKSRLMVIFCIFFFCVKKINVQRNVTTVSMFVCITVLNSKYMKPFWHDGHNIYTRNSSTLGVPSNVNEDDTSQWKLWIWIYLKCIHEQGEYFLQWQLWRLPQISWPAGTVSDRFVVCYRLRDLLEQSVTDLSSATDLVTCWNSDKYVALKVTRETCYVLALPG